MEQRSCLIVGSYTDHNIFDLVTPSQLKQKSYVGATLRLIGHGCACNRVWLKRKRKLVGGWWIRRLFGAGEQKAGSVLSIGPVSMRSFLGPS